MTVRLDIHGKENAIFVVPSDQRLQGSMVSKCSNPDCSASFLYLHAGKLFRFDVPVEQTGGCEKAKPVKKVEFFWLCAACVTKFTFVADGTIGPRVVPRVVALQPRARAAAAGS
jgi:hypothetical protein